MTSENLPPPPVHLMEFSQQLGVSHTLPHTSSLCMFIVHSNYPPAQNIDYQDLQEVQGSAPPPPPPSSEPQQPLQKKKGSPKSQKRDIRPDVFEKSVSLPRTATHPNYYPPEIAKFMTRVRNRSTDSGDPTQGRDKGMTREDAQEGLLGSMSKLPDIDGGTDRSRPQVPSQQQQLPNRAGVKGAPDELYDVPRLALKQDVLFEDSRQRATHGPNVKSSALAELTQLPPKSFSMPRGQYTPTMLQQYGHDSSRETTPNSPHTQSDLGDLSQGDRLQSPQKNPRSTNPKHNDTLRSQSFTTRQPPPFAVRPNRGHDSIPNSPTYFTHNHPHRDEDTPSPQTQLLNMSFQEHLNSLQPHKPPKSVHVMDWMQKSSKFWNFDTSFPMVMDPEANTPQKPHARAPHFYEQLNNPPPSVPAPAQTEGSGEAQRPPGQPPRQPLQAQRPPFQHTVMPFAPSGLGPRGQPFSPRSSASTSSLHKNPPAPLEPPKTMPTYPTATVGEDYYILDV